MKIIITAINAIFILLAMGCGNGNENQDIAVADIATDTGVEDSNLPDSALKDLNHDDTPAIDVPDDIEIPDVQEDGNQLADVPAMDNGYVTGDTPGDSLEPTNFGLNPRMSGCGGFAGEKSGDTIDCADEILAWQFDVTSGTTSFVNSNIWLNCCGIHDIVVFLEGTVYTILETDAPDNESGRCKCMCMFDYAIDVPGVKPGIISVKLLREIADDDYPPIIAWEGTIDLSPGSGKVVIAEDVGWCD